MNKSKQYAKVILEQADNGIVCTYCDGTKHVYKKIEQVAKALPGIFSVAEAEAPEETHESLEAMKANLKNYE